jgi:hypothetical protein
MVTAKRWRPREVREHRADRALLSMAQGSQAGRAASAAPIPPNRHTEDAFRGIEVWEQDTEPLSAEIHDFWWDTSIG